MIILTRISLTEQATTLALKGQYRPKFEATICHK